MLHVCLPANRIGSHIGAACKLISRETFYLVVSCIIQAWFKAIPQQKLFKKKQMKNIESRLSNVMKVSDKWIWPFSVSPYSFHIPSIPIVWFHIVHSKELPLSVFWVPGLGDVCMSSGNELKRFIRFQTTTTTTHAWMQLEIEFLHMSCGYWSSICKYKHDVMSLNLKTYSNINYKCSQHC